MVSDSLRGSTACLVPCLLMLAGCATRLWNLHHPATPVYDETHVGRFLNWYHDGAFFFDVHGPLAKLLMFWSASVLGFEGRTSCPYESTQPFVAACSLAPQRLVPALCGACMVPLTFATCCSMQLHPLAALLCSWFVLIDTLFLGVSRVHLNDMVQMLFIALTHVLAIHACRAPPEKSASQATAADQSTPTASSDGQAGGHTAGYWWRTAGTLTLTGVALGCALQCKYAMALTTLAWLGLQNLVTLGDTAAQGYGWRVLVGQSAMRGALLLGIPLALHLCFLATHFAHVPNTGNGDNYLSPHFQSTLLGNKHAASVAVASRPGFLSLAWEHAQAQFWYNRNMAIMFPRGSHPFDTAWHTWPLAARGIYFNLVADWNALASNVAGKHTLGFFLHPNPVITLLTTGTVVLATATLVARLCRLLTPFQSLETARAARSRLADSLRPGGSGSLVVAYMLHWLPYATQERQTFLLYYLPAYYFAILLAGRVWHATACTYLRPTVAWVGTAALIVWSGSVSWRLSPIAYGSPTRLIEWTAALRLASTECWYVETCWVDAT